MDHTEDAQETTGSKRRNDGGIPIARTVRDGGSGRKMRRGVIFVGSRNSFEIKNDNELRSLQIYCAGAKHGRQRGRRVGGKKGGTFGA